jgi:hypothetical protein
LSTTKTGCEYKVLDSGVHEFTMQEFSRAGVDAFIERIEQMNAALASDAGAMILVDSRQGTQPLNYLLSRLRRIERIGVRTRQRTHVAILLESSLMSSILSSMMRMLPQLTVRVFRADEHETAQRWLYEADKRR